MSMISADQSEYNKPLEISKLSQSPKFKQLGTHNDESEKLCHSCEEKPHDHLNCTENDHGKCLSDAHNH